MDFSSRWVAHLRQTSRQEPATEAIPGLTCPQCNREVGNDESQFMAHIQKDAAGHAEWIRDDGAARDAFTKARGIAQASAAAAAAAAAAAGTTTTERTTADSRNTKKRSSPLQHEHERNPSLGGENADSLAAQDDQDDHRSKKAKTPPPQTRGRAAHDEIPRGPANTQNRTLWEDGQQKQGRAVQIQPSFPRPHKTDKTDKTEPSSQPAHTMTLPADNDDITMERQPETKPISQDQLVAEVKGIYAGLVMVETKCIEVDNAQSSNKDANSKLNNEQWQALIALHRTLLHEHHDFFLASQHPSASAPLRRLASKYAMPARMWRHGIHSFLELLRRKLPGSLEHMLTFLYLAYSMMALLYETVPAFEDTWIECLGDLGRYRMAIEDDDIRDREVWTGVSRHWYSKASDKSPTTGRLYHHLAILARPNALQQHFFYAKSLCVPVPFPSARESVMTLFDPLLGSGNTRLLAIDAAFVRANGILFSGKSPELLDSSIQEFLSLLDSHISRMTKRWLEAGYFIGISLGCSLLGYGSDSNVIMRKISQKSEDADANMDDNSATELSVVDNTFTNSLQLTVATVKIVISRWGDPNILAFVHSIVLFLSHLAKFPGAMAYLEREFPWKLMADLLNQLYASCEPQPKIDGKFPPADPNDLPRPLPEDYAMRGLVYAEDYFPTEWFDNHRLDEDEKSFELPSMTPERKVRILCLGYKIAACGKWLTYNEETHVFGLAPKFDVDLEDVPLPTIET